METVVSAGGQVDQTIANTTVSNGRGVKEGDDIVVDEPKI